MVDVAVGVDDGLEGPAASIGIVEVDRDPGRLCRNKRIDDNDSLIAFDDGHVRQVLIADLINAVGDFEETADVGQLRLAPEARIDTIWRCGVFPDEAELLRIPERLATFTRYCVRRQGCHKTAMRVLEICSVGERQLIQ